jgi:pyrroloquinoline quinone biosynthesis protein E
LSVAAAIERPEDIAGVLERYTQDSCDTAWVERVIGRFRPYLCGETPRQLDFEWIEAVDPAALAQTASPYSQRSTPESVTWVVTQCCHRRCAYCHAPVRHHPVQDRRAPQDATFSHSAVLRLIDQMAICGTADLFLTGGEPLLRRDLPAIIRAAARRRIRVHLITKYPVDARLAASLAEAGLYRATVSLDDARAERVAKLAGRDYLRDAEEAIKALCSAQVRVSVHAVVTRLNEDGLFELAALAYKLGAKRFTFSPLSFPQHVKPKLHSLLPTHKDWDTMLVRLTERFLGRLEIEAVGGSSPQGSAGDAPSLVCESGVRTLHVLPDGRVTRCRLLPQRPELIFGDLSKQDLLTVWRGEPRASLARPSRALFHGSACEDCSDFDGCNARGRCYLQAIDQCGRLYGPDPFCTRQQGQ